MKILDGLFHFLFPSVDAVMGSSLTAAGGIVTTQIALATPTGSPFDAMHIAGYIISVAMGIAPILFKRWLDSRNAGNRVRRANLQEAADKARTRGDTKKADELDAQADELEIKIAETDALAGRQSTTNPLLPKQANDDRLSKNVE